MRQCSLRACLTSPESCRVFCVPSFFAPCTTVLDPFLLMIGCYVMLQQPKHFTSQLKCGTLFALSRALQHLAQSRAALLRPLPALISFARGWETHLRARAS